MDALLDHWALAGSALRPLQAGTQNAGWYVGDDFVLRIHRNTTAPDYEHAVLRLLAAEADQGGLPFTVPVPVPTVDGATVVRGTLDGESVTASLSRRIPGEHPVRDDVACAAACGEALAVLDQVLARLESADLPPHDGWDADLTKVHPRVPRVGDVVDGVPADRRATVERIITDIRVPDDLPRQLIHADFAPTNVLMVGERVTGVLDFEATGPGYRAMDLAVGLYFFGSSGHALQRAYLARFPLTDAELAAIPELQLLREATSLVHWYGRHLDGLIGEPELSVRVDRLIRVAAATY